MTYTHLLIFAICFTTGALIHSSDKYFIKEIVKDKIIYTQNMVQEQIYYAQKQRDEASIELENSLKRQKELLEQMSRQNAVLSQLKRERDHQFDKNLGKYEIQYTPSMTQKLLYDIQMQRDEASIELEKILKREKGLQEQISRANAILPQLKRERDQLNKNL